LTGPRCRAAAPDLPAYERLLADIEAGRIDAVIAWHPDRLHLSPVELEVFIDLVERSGVRVETAQAGRVDLATPAGRMNALMLGTVARYESEHKSDRIRRSIESWLRRAW
jgi:site-specific DNA recombinase